MMTQALERLGRTHEGPDTLRVLVVDDHPDVRLLVRRMLTQGDGFEVVGEAGDGVEAIEAASTLQPHVILLDLAMPRMTGHEALPGVVSAAGDSMVTVFSTSVPAEVCEELQAIGAFRCYEKGELTRLPALLQRDYEDFLAR